MSNYIFLLGAMMGTAALYSLLRRAGLAFSTVLATHATPAPRKQ